LWEKLVQLIQTKHTIAISIGPSKHLLCKLGQDLTIVQDEEEIVEILGCWCGMRLRRDLRGSLKAALGVSSRVHRLHHCRRLVLKRSPFDIRDASTDALLYWDRFHRRRLGLKRSPVDMCGAGNAVLLYWDRSHRSLGLQTFDR